MLFKAEVNELKSKNTTELIMISDRLKDINPTKWKYSKINRKLIRLLRYNFLQSNINIFENECNGKV